ncbi:MAG: hypothetical protein CM1200mP2_18440 [Planctomycetaceae bacterium]|nr:MAG: hypothetical protein CM1200mP2_18440 [Planctomycetaceae bacterium]
MKLATAGKRAQLAAWTVVVNASTTSISRKLENSMTDPLSEYGDLQTRRSFLGTSGVGLGAAVGAP